MTMIIMNALQLDPIKATSMATQSQRNLTWHVSPAGPFNFRQLSLSLVSIKQVYFAGKSESTTAEAVHEYQQTAVRRSVTHSHYAQFCEGGCRRPTADRLSDCRSKCSSEWHADESLCTGGHKLSAITG